MSEARAARLTAALSLPDVIALGAAALGLAVSLYLTVEHYTTSTLLACPESATVNCLKVTTSKWSAIAGVPVALLGSVYFTGMIALLVLALRRRGLDQVCTAAAAAGVLMVLYLIYVELFAVNAICLWCTAVHVLAVVLFAAVLWRGAGARA